MELSSGQQRLLFVVVVLVLAGLGIYLLGPAAHHHNAAPPAPSASSHPSGAPASQAPPAQPTTPPANALGSAPAASASGGAADIYQWLPFTQQDLTQAAQATLAFSAAYDTYSYTETAVAYGKKLAGMVTTELDATLENAYSTQDVAAQRSAQKQVSTSSGGIVSIRSFGDGSITFLVNIAQQLAITKGASTSTSTKTTEYAVTVVSQVTGWAVNDIELANAGNQ